MNILVTDGDSRAALAVTRSLGKRGYKVFVTETIPGSISSSSKYCYKSLLTPDPLIDGEAYSDAISEISLRLNVDVIFTITEQTIYCLNKFKSRFNDRIIIACASSAKMEAVSNKYQLFQMAERLGVAIPATVYVPNAAHLDERLTQISEYPVVVKPSFSRIQDGDKIISTSVMYAQSKEELQLLYATKAALRYPSMIQEKIVGEGTGLFSLFDQDHHLALFSHRRILEKPPSGGVSVLSESVPLDDEMVDAAQKLLSEVRWQGIAMVEFKRDQRDGRAKLMEINGRFWGSLQLAVSAGVDFPDMYLNYVLGKKPAELQTQYTVGQRLKWICGIVDHLIIRLKREDQSRILPPLCPTSWQVVRELLTQWQKKTSLDVYEPGDVRPFATEIKKYLIDLVI